MQFCQRVGIGKGVSIVPWLVKWHDDGFVLRGPGVYFSASALRKTHQTFQHADAHQAKHRLRPELAVFFTRGSHRKIGIFPHKSLRHPGHQVAGE